MGRIQRREKKKISMSEKRGGRSVNEDKHTGKSNIPNGKKGGDGILPWKKVPCADGEKKERKQSASHRTKALEGEKNRHLKRKKRNATVPFQKGRKFRGKDRALPPGEKKGGGRESARLHTWFLGKKKKNSPPEEREKVGAK